MTSIYFDMDGTIADLYGVTAWLEKLESENTAPYLEARPLLNMCWLARRLNSLQRQGARIGVISWTSKNGSSSYNRAVETAKQKWLTEHLRSVHWDTVTITEYGVPKSECGRGILFDDNEEVRREWEAAGAGVAYSPDYIIPILKKLLEN